MPVYAYVCTQCKKRFEKIEDITDHNAKSVACPKCKSRKVGRTWSAVNVHTAKKS